MAGLPRLFSLQPICKPGLADPDQPIQSRSAPVFAVFAGRFLCLSLRCVRSTGRDPIWDRQTVYTRWIPSWCKHACRYQLACERPEYWRIAGLLLDLQNKQPAQPLHQTHDVGIARTRSAISRRCWLLLMRVLMAASCGRSTAPQSSGMRKLIPRNRGSSV